MHAVTYFAPEPVERAASIGVKGFWRTYFGFRGAPLGACSAATAQAAFFGFAPDMVARAVPSVWGLAMPDALIGARAASAATALRRLAPTEVEALARDAWATGVLVRAIELVLAEEALRTADLGGPADTVTCGTAVADALLSGC